MKNILTFCSLLKYLEMSIRRINCRTLPYQPGLAPLCLQTPYLGGGKITNFFKKIGESVGRLGKKIIKNPIGRVGMSVYNKYAAPAVKNLASSVIGSPATEMLEGVGKNILKSSNPKTIKRRAKKVVNTAKDNIINSNTVNGVKEDVSNYLGDNVSEATKQSLLKVLGQGLDDPKRVDPNLAFGG